MVATTLKYFRGSLILSALGLVAGAGVGYVYTGTLVGALEALLITCALGALEFSLSLDNAVVNATTLAKMNDKWRHRFLTWGILIAVFGMRIVFPLVVVSAMTLVNPWQALVLAATRPDEYARIMTSAHISLAGFGASFLLLVALRYFLDGEKDVHWFKWIERPMSKVGRLMVADLAVCVTVLLVYSRFLHAEEVWPFLISSLVGISLFLGIHGLIRLLKVPSGVGANIEKSSALMFIYLECLDASFSLDGVIGAFAVTNNLFIIAIGLGIGAIFVRSLTVMLVEKRALDQFVYLEHGAFYAVGALAAIMLLDVFITIPEIVIGFLGIAIIGLSLLSSVRYNRLEAK